MRSRVASALSLAACVASSVTPSTADADVSSWLAFGGGLGIQRDSVNHVTTNAGSFATTIGVGSSPRSALVVGGVFRSTTYLHLGTDLGIAARFATGSFARGDFGVAVDLGAAGRFWARRSYGAWPLEANAIVGAPLGVQASVGVQAINLGGGGVASLGGVALLEIDLLRFSVYRQGTGDRVWWNYAPGGGRDGDR